jgi:hypothetical protein
VINVLNAYRRWVADQGDSPEERTIAQLAADVKALGGAENFAIS